MHREVPQWRRYLAALLLALLVGCQTWQPTTMTPRALLSAETPMSLRVTRTDGEVVTIKDPAMRNDSIISAEDGLAEVLGVPEGDVGSLEVWRFSPRRTLAFVAAGVAIALGWASAVTNSTPGSDTGPGPLPKDPG